MHLSLKKIHNLLITGQEIRSLDETEGPSECEALKKFHTWRATTANMVFKAEDALRVSNAWENFRNIVIENDINPFVLQFVKKAEYARYCGLLKQIIEKALVLDREISRQAAWVRWVFEDQNRRSDTAESDPPIDQERVRVIIAPALLKRGKSSGDKFEEQIELLSAESSVVQKLQSSRPPRTGWM
ncbi:uncharacterized protein F4807DRAFT_446331, partial [Annulohypoxylon truncatum]|uniref:uncharacterized protein n=1 Tax=Annulohypoxylon truncatum TaxID=327061 RepID=UPI002008928F